MIEVTDLNVTLGAEKVSDGGYELRMSRPKEHSFPAHELRITRNQMVVWLVSIFTADPELGRLICEGISKPTD